MAIFPKLCLWRRSLWSNLEGIGPEKLYRATLINVLFIYLHVCLHNPPREPLLLAGCVLFYCITRVLKWSKVVVSCCATFVQDIRKNVLLNTEGFVWRRYVGAFLRGTNMAAENQQKQLSWSVSANALIHRLMNS